MVGMASDNSSSAGPRVLLVTATAGYVHQSIPAARRAMQEIARSAGLEIGTTVDDVAALDRLTTAALAEHHVLCFVHTSGELPVTDDQKRAILDFVGGGKGFVGVHSASATLYEWPGYGELLGARFDRHPPGQPFTAIVADPEHPSTRALPPRFVVTDELYTFRAPLPADARVLLRAEPGALGLADDLPLAWTKPYRSGRVYYNALGHYDAAWDDPAFREQLRAGLRWTMRE